MPAALNSFDDRVDLGPDQHEVAGDCCLAFARRLKADRGVYSKRARRRELHAAFGDRIPARDCQLVRRRRMRACSWTSTRLASSWDRLQYREAALLTRLQNAGS
jgi:hypothetical protein